MSSKMDQQEEYDLVIVGAGMCGSAAARHAITMIPGLKILLIGPIEGSLNSEENGNNIPAFHSCHEDEGRITRRLDKHKIWASLASRSMDRYQELEEESGVKFHYPIGFMTVVGDKNDQTIETMTNVAKQLQLETKQVNDKDISSLFPFLDFNNLFDNVTSSSSNVRGILEYSANMKGESGAGYINARALVFAQQKVFQERGGIFLNDAVESISSFVENNKEFQIIKTLNDKIIKSKKVLVVTNNSTNMRPLLPYELDLSIATQTVVRFVISDEEALNMKSMPTMVVKLQNTSSSVIKPEEENTGAEDDTMGGVENNKEKEEKMESCYILPPVYYPSEKAYSVKMGHGSVFETIIKTEKEFLEWHEDKHLEQNSGVYEEGNGSGDEPVQLALFQALNKLLPHIKPEKVIFNRCAISNTKHGYPYIDILTHNSESMDEISGLKKEEVDDNIEKSFIGCCVGCNGYAAKSSDEIGRLAARMILSQGDDHQTLMDGLSSNKEGPTDDLTKFDWSDGLDPHSFRAIAATSTTPAKH